MNLADSSREMAFVTQARRSAGLGRAPLDDVRMTLDSETRPGSMIVCPLLTLHAQSAAVTISVPHSTGVRIIRVPDPAAFTSMIEACRFGIVLVPSSARSAIPAVSDVVLSAPDAHLAVLSWERPAPSGLSAMAGRRLLVLDGPLDPGSLVGIVHHMWFESRVEATRTASRQRPMAAVLTCAIHRILDERITARHPEPEEVSLCKTLKDLASRCGASRDTVRRASYRHGLDLRAIMRQWILILALRERFLEDSWPVDGWTGVARRCGYQSASGLRALFRDQLGITLSDVRFDHLTVALDRLHWLAAAKGS